MGRGGRRLAGGRRKPDHRGLGGERPRPEAGNRPRPDPGSRRKPEKPASGTRYVASAERWQDLPDLGLPEIAFVGRSNVGKSSLLGALLGRPKLVRTSRTPGRTQALNLFVKDDVVALVDLPGYGYAKLPLEKRRAIEAMLKSYLGDRPGLRGVVVLVDGRRDEVSELDKATVAWLLERDRRVLVAITKIDLIPKTRRFGVVQAIERQLGVPAGAALGCSAHAGDGIAALASAVRELV